MYLETSSILYKSKKKLGHRKNITVPAQENNNNKQTEKQDNSQCWVWENQKWSFRFLFEYYFGIWPLF